MPSCLDPSCGPRVWGRAQLPRVTACKFQIAKKDINCRFDKDKIYVCLRVEGGFFLILAGWSQDDALLLPGDVHLTVSAVGGFR